MWMKEYILRNHEDVKTEGRRSIELVSYINHYSLNASFVGIGIIVERGGVELTTKVIK